MTELPIEICGPPYVFVDPHGGKRDISHRRLSSRAAIVVAQSDAVGRIFVRSAWAARCSTDELIARIYATNDRFHPKTIGIEANGLQALFGDAIMRDARLAGKRLPVTPVFQPTTQEKDFRIRTSLQPLIGAGRIFLIGTDPGQLELRQEIVTFPQNPLKDLIDCLASVCRLMPVKQPQRVRDEEREKLLDYLRKTGADPAYVQSVAAGKGAPV